MEVGDQGIDGGDGLAGADEEIGATNVREPAPGAARAFQHAYGGGAYGDHPPATLAGFGDGVQSSGTQAVILAVQVDGVQLVHARGVEGAEAYVQRDEGAPYAALIEAGDVVVAELERSRLFSSVGTASAARGITALYAGVPSQLPLLFSQADLERDVAPRLEPAAIGARLDALAADVSDLAGIGAAARVVKDFAKTNDKLIATYLSLGGLVLPGKDIGLQEPGRTGYGGYQVGRHRVPHHLGGRDVAEQVLVQLLESVIEAQRRQARQAGVAHDIRAKLESIDRLAGHFIQGNRRVKRLPGKTDKPA